MYIRFLGWVPCAFLFLLVSPAHAEATATNAPPVNAPLTPASAPSAGDSQNNAYIGTLREAFQLDKDGKLDEAVAKATAGIQLNPQGLPGYLLRGSLYSQKKLYDQAEQDFKMALQISPKSNVVKFNLTEIKFLRKDYAGARAGFVELQGDPELNDLSSYKVFLCDLFGGRSADATKELDAFNQVGSKPSYYFSNAASDLFNHKTNDATQWLTSAIHIYSPQKIELYSASLKNLGYLPLPTTPTPAPGK